MQRLRAPEGHVALGWVDEDAVGIRRSPENLDGTTNPYLPVAPDLLARRPHRSPLRAGVVVPVLAGLAVVGAYTAATLLWPLYAVAPTATAAPVADIVSPAADLEWPAAGSAAVAVRGIDDIAASTTDAAPMASITKLVTVLMAFEQAPFDLGDDGATFAFTNEDRDAYWDYLAADESALDVPVDGELTAYQLMQGILIGSAGNYADRLATTYWPTDAVFAQAADAWLDGQGLTGITVVDPTGFDEGNTATPSSLIGLAAVALANPVVAEIVRTERVTLPGAGEVVNTNDLLGDAGVVGLKTGSLFGAYNLLAAQEATVGDTTVRITASVLGQPSDELRDGETERLLDAALTEASVPYVLPAGTVAGSVTTRWGARARIVTDADATAVLWNGAAAATTVDLDLGDFRTAGSPAGTALLTGPLDEQSVGVHLDADIPEPSPWWRLTHPLELWGLAG